VKRRALQLAFALGMLLTAIAVTVFVRGLWVTDQFFVRIGDQSDPDIAAGVMLRVNCRTAELLWIRYVGPPVVRGDPIEKRWSHWTGASSGIRLIEDGRSPLWQRLGFGAGASTVKVWSMIGVGVPTWFLVLLPALSTALPTLLVRRARQRRRRRAADGLCAACGYDLRGAAHDRCPECGEPVAVAAAV
jgi:hypothetical protein